ncbi:MAG: glycosyltransferase, partial [Bdellovibrionota bacterium]
MKIALVVDWHSERMGYSDNFLPKALAALGHEVHLITSNAQVYFNSPIYRDIFEKFLGPGLVDCGVKQVDGYTLHRLPLKQWRGRIHLQGLIPTLRKLKPEIVQAGEITSLLTYESAIAKPFLGYKLFVECHVHASVFPITMGIAGKKARLYWPVYNATVGRALGSMAERCYPISDDSADLATKYFG